MNPEWQAFVTASWPNLLAKGRVCAPSSLPEPAISGFKRPWVAQDNGQEVDWTAPLPDGSRIHIHVYQDGSKIVHRDVVDPSAGPVAALRHICSETAFGRLLAKVAIIAAGVYLGGKAGLYLGGAS